MTKFKRVNITHIEKHYYYDIHLMRKLLQISDNTVIIQDKRG